MTETPIPVLPCPFCGKSPALTRVRDVAFCVHCDNPECEVHCETSAHAPEVAIAAWNIRPETNSQI